jgi:hypothetical protein
MQRRTRARTSTVPVPEGPEVVCVEQYDHTYFILEGPRAKAIAGRMQHDPRWWGGPEELEAMVKDMANEERRATAPAKPRT